MHSGIVDVKGFFAPAVPKIFEYWSAIAMGQGAPSRELLDPLDMPKSELPHVMLIEYEHEPYRAKYRVVGTGISRQYSLDYTNLFVDQLAFPVGLEEAASIQYRQVWQTAKPIVGHYGYPTTAGRLILAEYAMLPLLSDGRVTHCLAVEHLDPRDEAFPEPIAPVKRKCSTV
jgi:hypothetical protein